jgi:autotransporter-associated beta strand protein
MKPTHRLRFLLLQTSAALALLVNHANAGTTWNGNNTTGNWGTASSWEGVVPTFAATTDLLFRNTSAANNIVSFIAVSRTVRSLTFNNNVTGGFTINLSDPNNNGTIETLTMGDGSNPATITVNSGAAGNILITTPTVRGDLILANNLAVVQDSTSGTLTIDRPITESGGARTLTKTGTGTLTLSNTNTFTGSTTVNAGSLVGRVGGSCASSAVSVAATSGNTATLSITNTDNTKSWTCASLTVNNAGTSSDLKFDFPSVSPSATVAPLVITGAATFTTTPAVTVALGAGSVIAAGNSYPLIARASASGTEPTAVTVTQPGATITAHLTLTGTTNYLVIDTYVSPQPLRWTVSGAGTWDTSSINWMNNFGTPTAFTSGDQVRFDETYITAPTTVTLNTAVTPASVTVSNVTHNYTISGSGDITGAIPLTKDGAAKLTLTTTNTYSGTTTITDGTLELGDGTIDGTINNSASVVNSGTLAFNRAGSNTYAGVISGSGTVTKLGAGTQTLSGASSFTGNITITDGTLAPSLAAGVANPTVSPLGNPQTPGRLITIGSTGTLNFSSGDVMGNGGSTPVVKLVANGGIIRNVSNQFNALGPVQLNGGTLSSFGGLSATFPSFALRGTITVGGSAVSTISSTGGNSQMGLETSGTTFDVADAVAGSDLNVTAVLANWNSNAGALIKTGAGTLVLTRTNTYTGATTITTGTLTLASTGSIATSSSVAVGAAGSLDTSAQATYAIPALQPLAISLDPTGSGSSGKIVAAGLDISSAVVTLNPISTLNDPVYVLATYTTGSLTGSAFAAPLPTVPSGYTLNYAYEGNKIALVQSATNNYASWANDPLKGNIPGEPATGDFDNDGITNIVEYALGQNPRVSSQPAGVLSGNVITFTKGADAIANGDVSWVIETSQTLAAASWTAVVTQPAADPALTISYTLTPSTPEKNFARLKVTQIP